jgi:hypothetical protein
MKDLAQAIRDLAQTGRLSEESEENISFLLDEKEEDDRDVAVLPEEDKDKSSAPTSKTTGGQKK